MRLSRIWPLAVAAVLLGACGNAVNDPGRPAPSGERMKPLVEQFKEARTRATSDFERQTLDKAIKTGKLTPGDYEEASGRYRQCVVDAGITETYTKLSNGIYRANPSAGQSDPKGYFDTTGECALQTGLARIEALYRTQVDNPDLLADPRLVILRCLLKAGLVPADYTTGKLTEFLGTKDMSAAIPANFDPMTPEAQKCLTAGGVAINLAPGSKGGG
jgi:hypothetical protein